MTLKLLPVQIPAFWENIKLAVIRADEVDKKNRQGYLVELLPALLNEKAQCWIRIDDQRILNALMITRVSLNKVTGTKHLLLQCFYSYKAVSDLNKWQVEIDLLKRFALKENCAYIILNTRVAKLMEIVQVIGFKEFNKTFIYNLGGR